MQTKTDLESADIVERAKMDEITKEDALYIVYNTFLLFKIADELRSEVVGDIVTYVINRNINFTNVCIGDCTFCAFKRERGYILSMEQILQKVEDAIAKGATEICIQGGLLKGTTLDFYCEMLGCVKSHFDVHLHAFSPMEVFHAAKNSNVDVQDALKALKHSGLDSMPGTAAEILDDEIRRKICPNKISVAQWIDIITTAHRMGIPTTATIMYGHIETLEHWVDHLLLIRNIQKKTKGFTEFIPLSFMPKNNELGGIARGPTSMDNLKMHALSRILLYPYVRNVQASWVKLGRKLARETLFCGVNDLGGTLMEEHITKSAGGAEGEYMSPEGFEELIISAGRIPKRRTTLYTIA
ncbi:MAG: 5-amino-6-(D-ribitylamino)uracil--L-tyrosine 4-hydroxyphenyl transferase CofH [Methanocellales archaeon]|nr:5-amino-6-(D-ribitylamino)uracil--L-tyrosine 4-hydroxyphenyl transferase CofH [Methanocellales archaeon]